MMSETFLSLLPELQMELFNMLKLSYVMRAAEMRAMMDMRIIEEKQQAQSMATSIADESEKRANGSGKGRTRTAA